MPRPVHFDISADDPKRAVGFYERVFGWRFDKWDGPFDYWVIKTGEASEPGIDGGMARRGADGEGGSSNTIGVGSIDETIAKVRAAGGRITDDKHAIPGVGWFAEFEDTEGNSFGLLEPDSDAK